MPRPLKPPVGYHGSKATLANQIIRLLPPHQHYIEPFAGSLAVLLAKPPAKMETVNDLGKELVTFWRVLRDRPDDLQRVCDLTPHSRAEHRDAYEPATDELETARHVWVRLTQGRAAKLHRRTGWRHYGDPSGSSISMPAYLDAYRGRLAPAAERLLSVSLECKPALDVVADYGRHPDALLFCDPPYLATTRTSAGDYEHEMTADDHLDLAEALSMARAAVVVCGYHSDLYEQAYAGWHRAELATWTAQGGKKAERTEVLWSNRPFPEQPARLFELAETGQP
jgi:DNA adenine methylase